MYLVWILSLSANLLLPVCLPSKRISINSSLLSDWKFARLCVCMSLCYVYVYTELDTSVIWFYSVCLHDAITRSLRNTQTHTHTHRLNIILAIDCNRGHNELTYIICHTVNANAHHTNGAKCERFWALRFCENQPTTTNNNDRQQMATI